MYYIASKAKKIQKTVVYAIIATILIMMLPTMALAAPSSDLEGHWAKDQIESWVKQGLVQGYPDGKFRPDNNISRAEFMNLVNNTFKFEKLAVIDYTDVPANAWYAHAVAKAKAAGYIAGYSDETMKPQNPITRQEAANIIMKVKKLQENSGSAAKFKDASKIAGWSKGAVGAVAAEGIMGGYPDGTFKANNPLKRAEAVVALGKASGIVSEPARIYDQAGTYGPVEGTEVIEGNLVVNVGSVTLQNMTINGNLLLAQSIGQGEVTLKNVTVKGTTDVKGGGENSIIVIDSTLGKVSVSKKDGKIRILLSGSSTVTQLLAYSGVKLEEKNLNEGGFKEIIIDAGEDDKIILAGAFESVTIKAAGVNVELPKETTVEKLILNAKGSVTGQGTVKTAEVNTNGVTFETAPKNIKTSPGVTAPTVGGAPKSGGGGGGSKNPTPPNVPAISLEYLGHSAFIMTTPEQKILMDPFEPDSFPGFPAAYTIPNESSIDLITVSHQHEDHNYVAAASSVNQIIYGVTLDEEEEGLVQKFVGISDAVYGDVSLNTILLPHFERDFPWGDEPNAGFIFETAGMRIVHPGDSFRGIIDGLTPEEITVLKGETGIDILMLPIGNAFGGAHDSEQLINFVEALNPKVVIPIHQWDTKEQFLDDAIGQGWDIVNKPATVNFSKDQLPNAGPVIWDMEQTVDFRPLFQSAVIDGSELEIIYNEALDESSVPAADDFMVWVNDSRVVVNEVTISGTTVLLTLAEAVTSEDTVELDYMVGDNDILDLAGNAANSLWSESVENITAVVSTEAPSIRSASTFDRDDDGILDAYLIFATKDIDDATVTAGSFMIDGIAATGFDTGLGVNDNAFWIYFPQNGHNTKAVPPLTVQVGAFKDLIGESNAELTAAEEVEEDGAHPVISPLPVEITSTTSAEVSFTSNETGAAYYVVLPDDDAAPNRDKVKAGQDSTGADATLKGSISVTEDVQATINITGLTPGSAYKVYLVAEDEYENLTYSVTIIDIAFFS